MIVSELMIQEALRYIQMPKAHLDDEMKSKISATYHKLDQISGIKTMYQCFAIESDLTNIIFKNTELQIKSEDLLRLFKNCNRCYIIAATLGHAVDQEITRMQKIDMLDAMVLDASASVLIETVCDELEQEIVKGLKSDEFLTMRFSPGYGDVPLTVQRSIVNLLELPKKMGMSLTKTDMLIPTKSITALIGISHQKEDRMKSCKTCNLAKVCLYRKRGDQCGL